MANNDKTKINQNTQPNQKTGDSDDSNIRNTAESEDQNSGLTDQSDPSDISETTEPSEASAKIESTEASDKSSDTQSIPESVEPEANDADKIELNDDNPSDSSPEASAKEEPTDDQPPQSITTKSTVKGAHWYVVHTHSGHEAKVSATLKQRIESQKLSDKVLDILVPTQEKIEIKEGKKSKVKEKIFPGYLLIRMVLDDSTWLAVRTTPGITSFVGVSNRPTPLPDQEVATIQRYMTMEAPKFKATFSTGEAVKIVDGPFSEFLGSISEIDEEKGKLKVLVSIFGRETPVELDFLQVAKL